MPWRIVGRSLGPVGRRWVGAKTQRHTDLNSQVFPRTTASRKLTTLEERARLFFLQELERKPALETGRRIMAVRVLELHGSGTARMALQEWSAGTPGLRLTATSRAAIGRMRRTAK